MTRGSFYLSATFTGHQFNNNCPFFAPISTKGVVRVIDSAVSCDGAIYIQSFTLLLCEPLDTAFKQQRLKAWQPILTPKTVLPTFILVGILFAPLGGLLLWASDTVSNTRLANVFSIFYGKTTMQGHTSQRTVDILVVVDGYFNKHSSEYLR